MGTLSTYHLAYTIASGLKLIAKLTPSHYVSIFILIKELRLIFQHTLLKYRNFIIQFAQTNENKHTRSPPRPTP